MTFSRNWLEQSPEAKEQGVCHTDAECKQMYAELDPALKGKAIRWFVERYKEALPEIAEQISKNPEHWIAPYHFGWGMALRNGLRQSGFSEKDFGIDNLDCIYRLLVEDAILYWQSDGKV